MKTLQQSTTELEATRRKVLESLIREKYKDMDVTEDFIQQEMDVYLEKLESGTPILRPQPQSGLTDAGKMADEFQEIGIDIYTVFNQLNHVSQRVNQHQKLSESILNDIRIKIRKLDEGLEEFDQLLRDQSAHGVYFETFIDSNSFEQDERLYTDRDGTIIAPDYHASLDVYQNALKLPILNRENVIVNFSGLKLAKMNITKQIGGGFIRAKNPEHDLEKAFDTSMETSWSETILSDKPLEVDLGVEYYGVNFGAACEMEINFDYITRVNELTFTPFTEYPMEVVSIIAYTTDHENEEGYEIVSPTGYLKNKESIDTMSFQFQDVVCKRLRILLNQKHYVKRDIIIDVEDKSIVDAWLRSQGHLKIDAQKEFKPIYQDQYELNPNLHYFNQYLKDHNIVEEIRRFKTETEKPRMQVSKYEYQYGLYNLAVMRNEYHHMAVYVSEPMIHANVHRAYLETVEEHPILPEINIPVTHIEYYLTDKELPQPQDWYAVLPKNIKEVKGEQLFPKLSGVLYKANVRFAIKRLLDVRKNGVPLTSGRDFKLEGRIVTIVNYEVSAIYTIDYIPDESAYYVDFLIRYMKNDRIQTTTHIDHFNGTQKGGVITLSHFPFIDKEVLNQQDIRFNPSHLANKYLPMTVQLVLPDGTHVNQPIQEGDTGVFVQNKTDYFDPRVSMLEPFTGDNFQYRVTGNTLRFNTELPEGTLVTVKYPYLTGPIRMKAIMRRNLHESDGLTPFLHEYRVVFQTLV